MGYLGKRKGIEYLAKAFNKLSEKYQNTELWMVGTGAKDTIEWLKKIIKRQNRNTF